MLAIHGRNQAGDMALSGMIGVLRRLGREDACTDAPDDGLLLTAFLERREAAAFEALVQRHGPMVFGVCRRILGHTQDAEDAFQAAFLVLARKGSSVRPRSMVGQFLYGVAYRTALQARAAAARRRSREMPYDKLPETPTTEREAWLDLQPVLDEELNRLSAPYRAAVVLCELEGRSRSDAARLLGIPEGTLSSRLAAARKILADRLTRRGLALPASTLATLIPASAASALPAPLVGSVVQAALAVSVSEAAAAGLVSANAATLASGVMKSMLLSKLKFATAWVLGVGLAAGGTGLAINTAIADGPKPAAERPGAKPAEGQPRNPNAPRDGQKPAGPRDGDKPRNPNAPRDGDKPRNPNAPKDGERPAGTSRDGERPAAGGGRGEPITLEGTISKQEITRKRDDGSTVKTPAYTLTDSSGARYTLPAPRVAENGKTLDSFNLADFEGKSVIATGRGFTTAGSDSSTKRVVRVISLSEVKAK